MSGTNPFERSRPAPETAATPAGSQVVKLEARKRNKQSYTVYLDNELMGRIQRLAKQKGVAASAVIEACIKLSLEQQEG